MQAIDRRIGKRTAAQKCEMQKMQGLLQNSDQLLQSGANQKTTYREFILTTQKYEGPLKWLEKARDEYSSEL